MEAALSANGCRRDSIRRSMLTLPHRTRCYALCMQQYAAIRRGAAAYADANVCFLTGGMLISALLFAPLCLTP